MAGVAGSVITNSSSIGKRKCKHEEKDYDKGNPIEDDSIAIASFAGGHASGLRYGRNRLCKVTDESCDGSTANKRAKRPLDQRLPNPIVELDGLNVLRQGSPNRIDEAPEQAEQRLEKMCGAVRTLLECVGEDPDREGLLATPLRYAKALLFLTKGYQVNVESVIKSALFHEGHDEMIIVRDIEFSSICEHHLMPFTGKVHIGYIPSGTVIGLSKLPRIVEMFSRRLQIQERLTKEVARAIMEAFEPQGVAVIMESSHLCMVIRGVEKTGTTTITSCVLGSLEEASTARNEFLSLVGVNKT